MYEITDVIHDYLFVTLRLCDVQTGVTREWKYWDDLEDWLCKEHGVKMNVWTVNDMAGLEQLHRWGCEGIITNFPGVASGWLRAQGE